MAKGNSSTAVAKREDVPPPTALALKADMAPDIAEAFKDGSDVQIPANAEQVIFTPSYTVPVGATVQGSYGGERTEEVTDQESGEVSKFESFLFKNLNGSGQDVWLRGGWNFGQLIKLAKTRDGERITMKRNPDKQHPRDPRLRIAQFDYYRGYPPAPMKKRLATRGKRKKSARRGSPAPIAPRRKPRASSPPRKRRAAKRRGAIGARKTKKRVIAKRHPPARKAKPARKPKRSVFRSGTKKSAERKTRRSDAARRGARARAALKEKRSRAGRKAAETRKANREGKRTHFQERIVFATFAQIKNGKAPALPERVAKAMRKALKRVAERMRQVYPRAVQDGYFALGMERAISKKMTGPVWEAEATPVWTGATHYMNALTSGWPELLASDNTGSARPYRVAILAVMADGFIREGSG